MLSAIPPVTVIMRSKNAAWVIESALDALFAQSFQEFELLVVDSGSTDNTLDLVRRHPCKITEIDDYYPGRVLNEVIAQVASPIIVFQNSDSVPTSNTSLSHLVTAFNSPETQAAWGRQVPRPEAHTWVKADYRRAYPATVPAPSWLPMSLAFAAMRRSAWEVRPFYTDAWGSEDCEWANWAKRQGWRVDYVPDAEVMHSHNYTLSQLYGRKFIEGEADAFIYKHAETARHLMGRAIKETARDVLAYLQACDLVGLPLVPCRRFVSSWAYFLGHRHGERRLAMNDTDASLGQRTVLDRYG